jgi:hypothetical protein
MLTMTTLGQERTCHWATWTAPGVSDHGDCVLPYTQQNAALESLMAQGKICWFRILGNEGMHESTNNDCITKHSVTMTNEVDALIDRIWPLYDPTQAYYSPPPDAPALWPWLLGGAAVVAVTTIGITTYRRRRK